MNSVSCPCFQGNSLSPTINLRRQFNPPDLINGHKRLTHITSCLNVAVSQQKSVELGEKTKRVIDEEAKVIVGSYARAPLVLSHGKGCKLFDVEGREYLDMTSGIAVNALGYGDPDWLRAVSDQAHALAHVSNIFYSIPMVQCGLGRTGCLWAHEAFGVYPDIMTLAKPLAGGIPIGATLVTERVSTAISPGDHGSTFAGGPLVCNAAITILDKISNPEFLADVSDKGRFFKELLLKKLGENPHVKEVRGQGLIIGIELDVPAGPLVDACRNSGLLILTAGKGNVVRLVPPLIVSKQEIEAGVEILLKCMLVLDANS